MRDAPDVGAHASNGTSVWRLSGPSLQCLKGDENGQNVDDITHGTTEEQKEEMRFELSRKSARRLLLFSESIAGRLFHQDFPKI